MAQKFDLNKRARGYAFTIFPEGDDFDDILLEFLSDHNEVYKCFGFEKCPTTGKLHMQGYFYFKNPIVGRSVLKIFTTCKPHWEQAKGSPQQNIDYCCKDDEFYEFGDRPDQGHRSDFDDLKEDIFTEGLSIKEIAMKHTNSYMRYSGAIEKMTNMRATVSDKCTVYHARCDNYFTICDWMFGTDVFEVRDDMKELYYYDNQQCVIFMSGMNVNLLTLLCRSRPVRIGNGYMAKEILPPVVVFFDRYWKRENNTYGYLVEDLPTELPE